MLKQAGDGFGVMFGKAILWGFSSRDGVWVGSGVSQAREAFCTTLPDGWIRWAERSVRVRCLS
jgi:hypothetical protein